MTRKEAQAAQEAEIRLSGVAVCPSCKREVRVFHYPSQPKVLRLFSHNITANGPICYRSAEPLFLK